MRFQCNTCLGEYDDQSGVVEYFHQCPEFRVLTGQTRTRLTLRRNENLRKNTDPKQLALETRTGVRGIASRLLISAGRGRTAL